MSSRKGTPVLTGQTLCILNYWDRQWVRISNIADFGDHNITACVNICIAIGVAEVVSTGPLCLSGPERSSATGEDTSI